MTASRPKVAYLVSRFPDFSEGFIRYEMKEVARHLGRLQVLPLVKSEIHEVGDLQEESGIGPDQVVEVPAFYSLPLWAAVWASLRKRPRAVMEVGWAAFTALFSSTREGVKWLALLPRMIYLGRVAERRGIDHIHAHFAALPAEAAWTINRIHGIPYSVTAHAYDLHLSRSLLRKKMSAASFGVTVSRYTEEILERAGPFREGFRWHVIRNGIPLGLFRPPGKRGDRKGVRLLSVGRLVPKKGLDVLIAACSLLRKSSRDFECVIVGDGPLRGALTGQVAAAGLSERVMFKGVLTGSELRAAYASADIFVLPCRRPARGGSDTLPVVIAEAMAAGLAVVSTTVAAIPELVRDGVEGLLVGPGDAGELAEALEKLVEHKALREGFSRAALKKVHAEYDVTVTAKRLASLFYPGPVAGDGRGGTRG